jgi:pantothenate kinase
MPLDQEKQAALLVDIHARVKSIEDRLVPAVADHEHRLRILEGTRSYLLGIAAAVAAGVSALASYMKNMLSGT